MPENADSLRRIGLFGGTFDPPHVGHLVTAVNVRHALELDVVVLMVANVPWQKEGSRTITPAADRLAMAQKINQRIVHNSFSIQAAELYRLTYLLISKSSPELDLDSDFFGLLHLLDGILKIDLVRIFRTLLFEQCNDLSMFKGAMPPIPVL